MTSRVITFSPRRSPHDEALVNAINDDCDLADGIVWPELNEPADWPENDEEWANRDFAGIPEFRTDGEGVGTPEFREALEAHFRIIRASCRFALAVLGNSRSELIAKAGGEAGTTLLQILARSERDLVRLVCYVRAAGLRQAIAATVRDLEAEVESEPPTAGIH